MGLSNRFQHLLLCLILQSWLYCSVDSFSDHRLTRVSVNRCSSSVQSSNALMASIDSTIENFEKSWVTNKIVAKSVKHTSFDWVCGKLRGLQATTSQFKKGSAVISVPFTETLSASDKGMDGCPEGLDELWVDLKGTSRVSIILINEWLSITKKNNAKSRFSTYIDALPAPGSLGTPFHWSDEYLENFPYTPLVVAVKLQKQRWAELYSKIQSTKSLTGVSYERFVWAMEIVRSRAFTGIGGGINTQLLLAAGIASTAFLGAAVTLSKTQGVNEAIPIVLGSLGALCFLPAVLSSSESSCVLLPAIDSSNHDGSNPLCNIALEPFRGSFQMIANRDIKVAEQITISYGSRNNDDLLQYFGFVEVNCAFDRYVILDPISVLKKEILENTQNISQSELSELKLSLGILEKEFLGGPKSIIINRKEEASWNLEGLGSIANSSQKKICLKIILNSEKIRMEESLAVMSSSNVPETELNPCVLRTFLAQKIDVLKAVTSSI